MKTQTDTLETPENDEIDKILNGAANNLGEPLPGQIIDYSEIPLETLQQWGEIEEAIRLHKQAVKEGRGDIL